MPKATPGGSESETSCLKRDHLNQHTEGDDRKIVVNMEAIMYKIKRGKENKERTRKI